MRTALSLSLLLLLAACSGGKAEPAVTGEAVYTVRPGDSLAKVARRFGTSVKALAQRNRLQRPEHLLADTRLVVPATAAAAGLPRYRAPLPPGPPLVPCDAKAWPVPQPAQVPAYASAFCSTGPSGTRVCAGSEARSQADAPGFFIEQGGARVAFLPDEPFMGDIGRFQVLDVDLDGDGDDEHVLASLEGVGNGLGATTWAVFLFEDWRSPPLSFLTWEYGVGTLSRREDGRGCDVLDTAWTELEDPLRGPGLYFVGRRFQYRQGTLVPSGAPVRARRFLSDFRGESQEDARLPLGHPARWLSEGWAEAWPVDPLLSEPVQSHREGTVAAVQAVKDAEGDEVRQFQVRWDSGETAWVKPRGALPPDAPAGEAYERLGTLSAMQALPVAYSPARPEALVGARVRQTFQPRPGGDVPQVVLWLSDARP